MQNVQGKLRDEFYQCLKKMEEQRFEVKDTQISSRMVNYYDTNGLLYNSDKEINKKRKFSIVQLCWLKVVKDLLEFGFDKEKILILKRGLEQFEYSDASKGRFYDTLTFHLTLIVAYKMDFRLILTKDEFFAWSIFSNTHQTQISSAGLLSNQTTLTIPLLGKIKEEWKKVTGELLQTEIKIYSPIEVEEKELLEVIRNKPIFKIELSFPDHFSGAGGKGKIVHKLEEPDIKRLGEFLRYMKHGEVRLTYGSEPGVPLYGSVAKTIKFKSRKDAVEQIIKRTK